MTNQFVVSFTTNLSCVTFHRTDLKSSGAIFFGPGPALWEFAADFVDQHLHPSVPVQVRVNGQEFDLLRYMGTTPIPLEIIEATTSDTDATHQFGWDNRFMLLASMLKASTPEIPKWEQDEKGRLRPVERVG